MRAYENLEGKRRLCCEIHVQRRGGAHRGNITSFYNIISITQNKKNSMNSSRALTHKGAGITFSRLAGNAVLQVLLSRSTPTGRLRSMQCTIHSTFCVLDVRNVSCQTPVCLLRSPHPSQSRTPFFLLTAFNVSIQYCFFSSVLFFWESSCQKHSFSLYPCTNYIYF